MKLESEGLGQHHANALTPDSAGPRRRNQGRAPYWQGNFNKQQRHCGYLVLVLGNGDALHSSPKSLAACRSVDTHAIVANKIGSSLLLHVLRGDDIP